MRPTARWLPLAAAASLACATPRSGGEPAQGAVALPREASRSPDGTPGYELPAAGYRSERNRCIDRELARRELNEYGDPRGTIYPEGAPLEVAQGVDRHAYVLRRNPGIGAACVRSPLEDR